MFPLSDSGSANPAMPTRMQSSSMVELVGLLGPVGTLLPGEDGPGLCPIGLTVGLLPVAAVPLPAVWDPMIALSPVEGLERDCVKAGEESMALHGGFVWSRRCCGGHGGNGGRADDERCYIGLCGRVRGMG